MEQLIKLLHEGNYSCVIRNGEETRTFTRRGVADLYDLLYQDPAFMKGALLADKVVGKGVAALMILGGIARIYTDIISRPALDLLHDAGIPVDYVTLVPHIENRDKTGWCPVETLCYQEQTAEAILPLIDGFIRRMRVSAAIIAAERAALEEWNKGNPSGYLAIYAPNITYFDPFQEKRLDGIEQVRELYESLRGKVSADRYNMINPHVEVSGAIAVLSYNLDSYAGDILYQWNCTEVFQQNEEDQWKIIHNHWSLVKPLKGQN